MVKRHFTKAAILMLLIVVVSVASWEIYLRQSGHKVSYDDGSEVWAQKRDMVYQKNATVFIGSSRIKYDLDIDTWRKLTDEDAVQLAMEGTSPRPVLKHLADDNDFKGRLIIDVTEGLFFGRSPGRQAEVAANLDFYKNNHTPAQKGGTYLNGLLESQFVFLDRETYSLTAKLDELKMPPRKGVFSMPYFPFEFRRYTADRQAYMTPEFVTDTSLQNQVIAIWGMMAPKGGPPPISGDSLNMILASVKNDVDRIRSRGGEVLFVRTPSSGHFLAMELKGFPRNAYWDPLLSATASRGIHFMDYPAIAGYQCPELSHLSPDDAIDFTKHFISILDKEMNWFKKNGQTEPTTKTIEHAF